MIRVHRPIALGIIASLKEILQDGRLADKVIEHQFKANRQWGSRDRRQFSETVYDLVRWWRSALYQTGIDWPSDDQAPSLDDESLWRVLAVYGRQKELEFDGAPDVVPYQRRLEGQSRAITQSYPEWLDAWAAEQVVDWPNVARVLNEIAPVFLRANRLKADPEKVAAALRESGHETEVLKSDALVLKERANIFGTPAFQSGLFEMQDLHSQWIAPFMNVEPGQRVIDACAGAGGKTLHLAALMKNKGKILALDVHDKKLLNLKARARRAGCDIIEPRPIESTKTIKRLEASCDRLLLDVPCTGLGVMRRNPDKKWRLRPSDVVELQTLQAEILDRYTRMCKPGGMVVYSTCSIARAENEEQVQSFLKRHPTFVLEEEMSLPPRTGGGDGFYAARIKRLS